MAIFRSRFGNNFFEVDVMDESGRVVTKVGSAKMRVIRHQANYLKVVAKNSMRRTRQYRSEAELPGDLALIYRERRRRWHIQGEDPVREPKVKHFRRPSPPGHPPGIGRNPLLKRFLFANATRRMHQHGGSYIVGPQLLPGMGSRPEGTVPEVHEYSGTKLNQANFYAGNRMARYPRRPYMGPALHRAAPAFARMWQDQVRP